MSTACNILQKSSIEYIMIDIKDIQGVYSLEIVYFNEFFKKCYEFNSMDMNEVLGISFNKEEIDNILSNEQLIIRKNKEKNILKLEFFKEEKNRYSVIISREELENSIDFIATISHELRTPINLILSSLQVLDLKLNSEENIKYKIEVSKYLKIINQNGLRLLRLVNNIIDSSKIDYGKFDYNPKNYDIVNVIEEMCISTYDFVKQQNIEIIFDTDVEEHIAAFDIDNMERIILNLLSNAIKFNKPNGKIEVTLSCVDEIVISIKDFGVGIPKNKIKSLFKKFEQLKNSCKVEKQGSGIGLFLVKSLVESQNGKIFVNSIENIGTEFIIVLPNSKIEDEVLEQKFDINCNLKVDRMKLELSDIY
ncbi:MAG: HAMP domain-containing sensor histidine kinase [Peptostreptococcaceae bacterium]